MLRRERLPSYAGHSAGAGLVGRSTRCRARRRLQVERATGLQRDVSNTIWHTASRSELQEQAARAGGRPSVPCVLLRRDGHVAWIGRLAYLNQVLGGLS